MKTPTHLSPSGLSMWRQCPQKYVHAYLEDHPREPATIEMVRGTFVHAVLERLTWLPPTLRTPDMARLIGRQLANEWDDLQSQPDFTALELDRPEVFRFLDWTWNAILAAFDLLPLATMDVAATELRINTTLGGVPFHGFIDLVERETLPGTLNTLDYKTGEMPEQGKPWSQATADEKLLQPLLYAAALREMGHRVHAVGLVYIPAEGRSGVLGQPADDRSLDNAVAALSESWVEIQAVAAGEAEAPKKPSALCGWCDFLAICPEGQREVETRISLGRSVPTAAVKVVMS